MKIAAAIDILSFVLSRSYMPVNVTNFESVVKDENNRSEALSAVAQSLAQSNKIDDAIKIAKTIEYLRQIRSLIKNNCG